MTSYEPTARPGARLPHVWLPDGTSVYDLLGDGFTLLRLGLDAATGPLSEAATRLGIPLRVLDLAHLPRLRTLYEADLVLVRPDQHVAWRGADVQDPEALLRARRRRRRRPERRCPRPPSRRSPDDRRADPPPARRPFPNGFLWGAATAAHQVEGGNVNNDHWEMEHAAALAVRRAQRRRLRLLPPLARGPRPGGRRRAEHLPVQPRVEPDRARGGRVLPRRPRPLPADRRRLPRARPEPDRHARPLHDAALADARRRLDRAEDRRPARPLRRVRGAGAAATPRTSPRSTSRT